MESSTRQKGRTGDRKRQTFGPPLPPPPPQSALSSPINYSSPLSEDDRIPYTNSNSNRQPTRKNPLRRVQRVSRHAALTTKQVVWDSNELSIEAALSAVNHYEAGYNALRGFLVQAVCSAHSLYRTAKVSAHSLEHGLLAPVRDWILLPAFSGAEKAVAETQKFLASDTAHEMAEQSITLARNVPFVGPVLAPTICWSGVVLQRTWEILQYPIPSKQQVRDTVDWSLNTTKWALTETARAIVLYAKRADANITRTLSHTQWKVLGSGPYATLDATNKQFVIDHLCERYFSIEQIVGRYELAAHIKRHNPRLYLDLRGVLLERGGEDFADDEWLKMEPIYHTALQDERPFLLPHCENDELNDVDVSALWFRLPQVNGKTPPKDAPWICFRKSEQYALEARYCQILKEQNKEVTVPTIAPEPEKPKKHILVESSTLECTGNSAQTPCMNHANSFNSVTPPPTIAQWYDPSPDSDVFVDQMRHAVSFFLCCPKCRQRYPPKTPPIKFKAYRDECDACALSSQSSSSTSEMFSVPYTFCLPPIGMVMRPTFWRFYGNGDDVRRSSWFLDTARHGLQPFDDEAQVVLEDAYFFLKWLMARKSLESERLSEGEPVEKDGETPSLDDALLTVEVSCPDGTERLIQFNSLKQATAIQKGLGAAVAVFKRRVYRGAWLLTDDTSERETFHFEQRSQAVQEAIQKASENHGLLGETTVPDVSIRSIVASPSPLDPYENSSILQLPKKADLSLAAPPDRLSKPDMLRRLKDHKSSKIDHLCLVVHGIGEMLRSIDLFGLSLQDLTSCCLSMRNNHVEVQDATFAQLYPTADASSRASTGRVEYLPVEWHESFAILTQRREPLTGKGEKPNVMMQDISLRTIPNMREFANDTLMDVLFFMSPQHHDVIIDVVTHEMNFVVDKFRKITGFCGSISVVGHSLGSIISWDILNNQNPSISEEAESNLRVVPSAASLETVSPISQSDKSETTELASSVRFSQSKSIYPQLNFKVDNFFLLGSPLAVFLMIRNQRAPLNEDFFLRGCGRVFNVFHPYDPVAYRIEPCIDPRNAEFEPTIIKHWNGGFRVQYRTRRIWRKIIETTSKTQHTVVEAFEQSMAGMGLLDATVDAGADDDSESEASQITEQQYVVTGLLNQGRRIDYMLQEREIENANEYVAALAAHSSYWTEKDLSLFIARQIYLSTLEHAAAEADASAGAADWESISPDDIRITR